MERESPAPEALAVQETLPSVRALQAAPETLTPVRHGFLWKRSKIFRTWLSRWVQLDSAGWVYAHAPKLIRTDSKSVLPSEVHRVEKLPTQRYVNGATMYGFRAMGVGGSYKDWYSDDEAIISAWAHDLVRSTPAARKRAAAQAALATAAPGLSPMRPAPPSGDLRLSDYCEVDWSGMLGSGLFACVMRGRMHSAGIPVAVKIIKTEAYKEYGEIIRREAMVWSAAGRHPHVAQLLEVLESPIRMYFLTELCEGGGLVQRLACSATYCEREVAWLTRQLLAAVHHLHSNAIVHMDIKPENVVFATRHEDSTIKLIDFSLASFFYSPTDPGGTPDFMAPELLNNPDKYTKAGCGPEVDMWAVGVMLFFLLSGQTPFQGASLEQVLKRVRAAEWAFVGRRWALVSDGARDLVSALLREDPAQRLSAAEALEHPWLQRPEGLSQALLSEAVASFKLAASAAQEQRRHSWAKQASRDDLLTTRATLHNSATPHTSAGAPLGSSNPDLRALSVGPPSYTAANGPQGRSMVGVFGSGNAAAAARAALAGTAQGSFSGGGRSPRATSGQHSPHASPGGTPCSPRSPLGMHVRTRRASETMAYALALTERHESLTQAQAQGIEPSALAAITPSGSFSRTKARRASEVMSYGSNGALGASQRSLPNGASPSATSPSASQADLGAAGSRAGLSAPTSVQALGRHRGTSGLSVVTTRASLAQEEQLQQQQAQQAPTSSSAQLRDVHKASSSGALLDSRRVSSAATSHGGSSEHSAASSRSSRPPLPQSSKSQVVLRPSAGQLAYDTQRARSSTLGAPAPPSNDVPSATHSEPDLLHQHSTGPRPPAALRSAGKSASYHAMPNQWLDGQGPAVQPAGAGAAGGAARGAGAAANPAIMAYQRRGSMSFTHGMPHGPSPLSVSSGGPHRVLPGGRAEVEVPPPGAVQQRIAANASARASATSGTPGTSGTSKSPSPTTSPHASPAQQYAVVQVGTRGSVAGAPTSNSGAVPAGLLESSSGTHTRMYQAVLKSNLSSQGYNIVPTGEAGSPGTTRSAEGRAPSGGQSPASGTALGAAQGSPAAVPTAAVPSRPATSGQTGISAGPAAAGRTAASHPSGGASASAYSALAGVTPHAAAGGAANPESPSTTQQLASLKNLVDQLLAQGRLTPEELSAALGSSTVTTSVLGSAHTSQGSGVHAAARVAATAWGPVAPVGSRPSGQQVSSSWGQVSGMTITSACDASTVLLTGHRHSVTHAEEVGPGTLDIAIGGSRQGSFSAAAGGGRLEYPACSEAPLMPLPVMASPLVREGAQQAEADAATRHGDSLGGAGAGAAGEAPRGRPNSILALRSLSRAAMASQLETIPSEDPDSLSGLLRTVREERDRGDRDSRFGQSGGLGPASSGEFGVRGGGDDPLRRLNTSPYNSQGVVVGDMGSGEHKPTMWAALQAARSPAAAGSASGTSAAGTRVLAASPGAGAGVAGAVAGSARAAGPGTHQQPFTEPGAVSATHGSLQPAASIPIVARSRPQDAVAKAASWQGSRPGLRWMHGGGGAGGADQDSSGTDNDDDALRVERSSRVMPRQLPTPDGGSVLSAMGSVMRRPVRPSTSSSNLRQTATTAAAAQAVAAQLAATGAKVSHSGTHARVHHRPNSGSAPNTSAGGQVPPGGLRGASLQALLAQAAPLAAAAQASAVAQAAMIASFSSGTTSPNGSFTAQRSGNSARAQSTGNHSPGRVRRTVTVSAINPLPNVQLAPSLASPTSPHALTSPTALTSPREGRPASGKDSGAQSPKLRGLAAILQQAAPLAAASQANAAAQVAMRTASAAQVALMSSGQHAVYGSASHPHSPVAVPSRLSGSGRSSPRGSGNGHGPSGTGMATRGNGPSGTGMVQVQAQPKGPSVDGLEPGAVGPGPPLGVLARRSNTSIDLQDRLQRTTPTVHRLASQGQAGGSILAYQQAAGSVGAYQQAGGSMAGYNVAGGSVGAVGSPVGVYGHRDSTGSVGACSGVGGGGDGSGGAMAGGGSMKQSGSGLLVAAPAGASGEPLSPGSRGAGGSPSTRPVVPSRLSNPGTLGVLRQAGSSGQQAVSGSPSAQWQQVQAAQQQQLQQLQQFHQQQQQAYQQRSRKSLQVACGLSPAASGGSQG